MKKWIIIFIIMMAIITTVKADDQQLFTPLFGDEDLYSGTFAGDIQLGTFWSREPEPITDRLAEAGGGGGISYNISTIYYDIIIDGVKSRYTVEDIIYVNITIINKGDAPDRDAILKYYLKSPTGIIYGESQELFEEVPPTCPNAIYDRYNDICLYDDEFSFTPLKYIIKREIALPFETTIGEWKFYVEYETEIQPLVSVFKNFWVYPKRINLFYILVIILIVYYMYNHQNQRRYPR